MTSTHADLVDVIIARGAAAGIAVSEEVARRIRDLLRKKTTPADVMTALRVLLEQAAPLLARTLADTLTAGWISGAKLVYDRLPFQTPPTYVGGSPPLQLVSSDPDESDPLITFPALEAAAADLRQRRLVSRQDFDLLSAQAQEVAFTAAHVATLDGLEKVRDALVAAVDSGETLREFSQRVDDALGGSALAPAHVENVFRTNVMTAYAVGREQTLNHPLVRDAFPYVLYSATHDSRARPEHLAMEKYGIGGGAVYRRDDPIWRVFTPPWSYQCRCVLIPLTLEDAANRYHIREAESWLETGLPPTHPHWVEWPEFEPLAGWVGPWRGGLTAG